MLLRIWKNILRIDCSIDEKNNYKNFSVHLKPYVNLSLAAIKICVWSSCLFSIIRFMIKSKRRVITNKNRAN